ncbi:amino-acid N-acetyltransferase-like protein subunit Mak10 [Dendryphion nanum]|uniref:Amino-acid N-acetyltransferase-like protein subunit Mak10 n=1 Tax=Dendryphion nanum TaxID=256645 RepID=A0A9P9DDX3_9PLEO|nr:amino-acid N-acetyltransferase-like protein subunit Mak10 [Dendryphion nanum]
MAEESLRHTPTAPDLNNTDAIAELDGSGPSDQAFYERQGKHEVNLPLRQMMQPVRTDPKVHDITNKFTEACRALEVGQLVKDEYFTLFESIGALEIMDPKMDSGFLQPGETLEDEYDTLAPLLPEEVIGIMDQLLCYEMAWHTGYPLSQTLFTSVYIDKLLWPEPRGGFVSIEQSQFYRGSVPESKRPGLLLEVLRAYCLALVKCCDFVIAKVQGRDYFEEEDFCTHTYNRVLFAQVPMDVFTRELDAVIEVLEDEQKSDSEDTNTALWSAIIKRLQFRKDFLIALDPDCSFSRLASYWPPLLEHLTSINVTQQLGKFVPGSFSTKIQRRLASTVPPRPIVELAFPDAFKQLTQLCTDCQYATEFTTLTPDPLEYQSFLCTFAARNPAPLPYSRSYLATILFHPETVNTALSLPLLDLRTFVLPSSPLLDPTNWTLSPPMNPLIPKPPRLQLALYIDEFIERAGQAYLDLWTSLGQNRCRLRRMLHHVIAGWDQLQTDASLVDEDISRVLAELQLEDTVMPIPLTTWVWHKKLWMMSQTLLLGFEQDIYLPDEYASMYYFLSCISARRAELLSTMSTHFSTRIMQIQSDPSISATTIEDVAKDHAHITYLLHESHAIFHLSTALSRFYTLLLYTKLLPIPNRPFSSEKLRYELRMKPFLTLQPPEVPPFEDMMAVVQPYGAYDSASATFKSATAKDSGSAWKEIDTALRRAREEWAVVKRLGAGDARARGVEGAWGRDVQGVLASCVALGVAVVGVREGMRGGGVGANIGEGEEWKEVGRRIKVEIPVMVTGKRYAEGWVVPRVSKI